MIVNAVWGWVKCWLCHGHGRIATNSATLIPMPKCPKCGGRGWVWGCKYE